MSRDLSLLLPTVKELAERFLDLARQDGHELIITEAYRSPERQAELYAKGRSEPGSIVTNAIPGWSWHQWKRALDFAFAGPDPFSVRHPWDRVGEIGEKAGLLWGGRWKRPDRPHLELPGRLGLGLRCAIAIDGDVFPGAPAGPPVEELQKRLRDAGFSPGPIDGSYGKRTKGAVRMLQSAAGLPETGLFGLSEIEALETALEAAQKASSVR